MLHGKEGVDGSSPSEGLERKALQKGMLCCLSRRAYKRRGYTAGTHFWDRRAFAGKRDVWRRLATRPIAAMKLRDPRKSPCTRVPSVALLGKTMIPSLQRGGQRRTTPIRASEPNEYPRRRPSAERPPKPRGDRAPCRLRSNASLYEIDGHRATEAYSRPDPLGSPRRRESGNLFVWSVTRHRLRHYW
jgi:hypothetical protein